MSRTRVPDIYDQVKEVLRRVVILERTKVSHDTVPMHAPGSEIALAAGAPWQVLRQARTSSGRPLTARATLAVEAAGTTVQLYLTDGTNESAHATITTDTVVTLTLLVPPGAALLQLYARNTGGSSASLDEPTLSLRP